MKTTDLDKLIEGTKNQAIPACPENMEQNVLRRVHLSQAHPATQPLWFWQDARLQWGTAAIMVLMTISITFGLSTQRLRQDSHRKLAVQALHFDVFANQSLSLQNRSHR